jgi:hypothetical protein
MTKTIAEHPNYSISTDGTVRNIHTRRVLKQDMSRRYPSVRLGKSSKSHSVHRLVASAFIPNPTNKAQVNHKDGVKTNNHVDNLEWMTASENMKHAVDTGLKPKTTAKHQAALKKALTGRPASIKMIENMRAIGRSISKITIDDASELCEAYATGLFTQRELAKKAGISASRINQIIQNKWSLS